MIYEARVIKSHPNHTVDIQDPHHDNGQIPGVRVLVQSLDAFRGGGEANLISAGNKVLVLHMPNIDPICLGVVPEASSENNTTEKITYTDVTDENPLKDDGHIDSGHNRPDDLIPGDWSRGTKDGNLLAVLMGGLNIFKAGPLAQIIASNWDDLVRIIGRQIQIWSDAGKVEFLSDNGKTTLKILLGKNNYETRDILEQSWSIVIEIGHIPNTDTVILFSLKKRDKEVAGVKIDSAGNISFNSADIAVSKIKNINVTDVADLFLNITKSLEVKANDSLLHAKTQNTVSAGQLVKVSAPRVTCITPTEFNVSSQGRVTLTSMENTVIQAGQMITGGNLNLETFLIGDINISVLGKGDVNIEAGLPYNHVNITSRTGNVVINSKLPGGIQLGGVKNSAVLFNEFATLFGMLITKLQIFIGLFDGHTTTNPVGGIPLPMVIPPPMSSSFAVGFPTLYAQLAKCRSLLVTISH